MPAIGRLRCSASKHAVFRLKCCKGFYRSVHYISATTSRSVTWLGLMQVITERAVVGELLLSLLK